MPHKRTRVLDENERVITDVEKARKRTFDRAVNLLTFKPRSIRELRERLLEKDWTNARVVDDVIKTLETYGYLNDAQFAKDFAASKLRQKPVGKHVLRQKLFRKKLDKETIDEAIEKAFETTPEEEMIDSAIEKRLRIKGKPATREDAKKFYDFLLRQGFSYDLVRDKMREINSKDFESE
jgi:regulatory protein